MSVDRGKNDLAKGQQDRESTRQTDTPHLHLLCNGGCRDVHSQKIGLYTLHSVLTAFRVLASGCNTIIL